jgi:hypothetical protein
MPKHTPGPWDAEWSTRQGWTEGGYKGLSVHNGDDAEPDICQVPDDERADGTSRMANARLIAAAPDLLAALELIVTWQKRSNIMTRCGGAVGEIIAACDAAIAKAKE